MISKEMVKKGHDVHIITQRLANTKPFEVIEGLNVHRVGSGISFSGTLPLTVKHNLSYLILATKLGITLVRKNLKEKKRAAIIHSNPYIPSLSAHLCSKFCNVPHVISFYDVFQADNKEFWKKSMEKDITRMANSIKLPLIVIFVERLLLKLNVCKYHTLSEMSRLDMTKFGVDEKLIRIIPPGLDPLHYEIHSDHDSKSKKSPTVVFVGRLIRHKNIQTIIRAFEIVIRSMPESRLIIVGDGPQKNELIKEAEVIKDNIKFTGIIPHSEKLRLLNDCSLVAFPSLIEGFGITVLEAFACSKPIIVSDVRPLSDIVVDNSTGYVVPPFDAEKWAERMSELLSNDIKREQMGQNAYREFLSNYQLNKIAEDMENLYDSCLKQQDYRY